MSFAEISESENVSIKVAKQIKEFASASLAVHLRIIYFSSSLMSLLRFVLFDQAIT
jgi:hypothetical protein